MLLYLYKIFIFIISGLETCYKLHKTYFSLLNSCAKFSWQNITRERYLNLSRIS